MPLSLESAEWIGQATHANERIHQRLPETNTVTVADLIGVAEWAEHNASPADVLRITAIISTYGRDKARQFEDQPTLWEIDWFFRGAVKEFYRLALINSETLQELWGFS